MCTTMPKNHQPARIYVFKLSIQLVFGGQALWKRWQAQLQPEPTHNFLDHPSNQEVGPRGQTIPHNISNVHSTTRNCKISYSAPTASELGSMKTAAILFTQPPVVVDNIMKGTPTDDMSLKWLEVTFSRKSAPMPSRKVYISKKNKTLTYLKAIFHVNPVNSEFCSYTMLKTFAPQISVFRNFPDNAWE